ncbi:hephaestin isoform X3 [Eublepharis macularius]|uniref:ferroxidase n=1 Tax=Eublepharis macularius TaxID=481883 RepID=A0AA97LEC1_EUBMA|nr:hephaestin isoform X3 [Eublepharis macularius]
MGLCQHAVVHIHFLLLVLAEGTTRVYYLGIREVEWDYAPLRRNEITGQSITDDLAASNFLQPAKNRIGSIYKKSVYKQYVDSTYTTEVPKPTWLGFLGPIIQAEVGDTIRVHLKNFATRPFTVHPHGVFYEKDSEGSQYPDTSSQDLKKDDAILPGGNHTYTWTVPEDHGPTTDDPACLTWIYHSHIDAPKDIATGLIGPLLICKEAGMEAFYEVRNCSYQDTEPELKGKLRKYYIAAKEVQWNYGPTGFDQSTGQNLQEPHSFSELFFKKSSTRIGGTYWKAKFVEYTDGTFRVEKERPKEEKYLGILGPVIKAEVGDTIQVTFANKASWPFSIQPHGVFYRKEWEGTLYHDGFSRNGAPVKPLGNFTYRWTVPQHVGPTAADPPCLTWMYSSAVDPTRDTNSGLVGPLLICRPGTLSEQNKQKDVDREFYLLFGVFDENLSWYLDANLKYFLRKEEAFEDQGFMESNRMHAINGFMFSNLPGLDICKGERVSWHLLGLGTEADVHGAVFQGNTVLMDGMRRDAASLFPHTFATALMQPDNEGTFEVYCQTSNHYQSGMRERYSVQQCGKKEPFLHRRFERVRTVYIIAEEVDWDYAPDRSWELERHNGSGEESYGNIFLSHGNGLLGSKYKKAVYREYTDGTFKTPKNRTNGEEHLGILGPFIWAEVGDILNIVFKNNATRPYSIHAHGIVEKSERELEAAAPGEIATYRWDVPERSGPGPNNSACVSWVYYSKVDPVKDLFSGLVGPLKVCRKGMLDVDGRVKGVSREFALLFLVFDENQSWYLEENVKNYAGRADGPHFRQEEKEFLESNKMHAINGKLYANLPGLTMYQGDQVNWYLLGMGQEVDVHTVHFHAETFIYQRGKSYRADVVDLFPGTFEMVEMLVGNPGTWLLHCHVADHIHAGMETLFTVLPRPDPVLMDADSDEEIPPDSKDDAHQILVFGTKVAAEKVAATLLLLTITGIVLLLVACALLGVIVYLQRQRRLRRNRRSILDEGFKLMSTKQQSI